jgi:hypothetical protein
VTQRAEPASTAEALRMLSSAMSYLAAADPTAMSVQAQADCLLALERLDAVEAAARAWILGAFTSGHGYSADADYSPTSWLIHKTRITKDAARGHLGWARRTVTLNPDGTTTARSPDGTKVLHSHSPP